MLTLLRAKHFECLNIEINELQWYLLTSFFGKKEKKATFHVHVTLKILYINSGGIVTFGDLNLGCFFKIKTEI